MTVLPAIVIAAVMAIAGQDPKPAPAPALSGHVLHHDTPIPGAIVTAIHADRTPVTTTTDDTGAFAFMTLEPGVWTLKFEMPGFATVTRDVAIPPAQADLAITMSLKTYAEIVGAGAIKAGWPAAPPVQATSAQGGADPAGILNGSLTNGAATRFAQPKAIGNNRPRPPAIYSGALTGNFGDSGWNAQPYGFGATAGPSPNYSDAQLGFSIGGPVKLPFTHLWIQQVRASYQHNLQHNTTTRLALVPTADQRLGDLSSFAGVIRDPQTGLPFDGNIIPADRIVPQATALLALYPLPTGSLSTGANFQRTLLTASDSDRLQIDSSQNLGRRMQLSASAVYSRSASDAASLFDFVDNTRQNSLNVTAGVLRRQTTRLNLQATYQFSRADNTVTPYFANRIDVSDAAGITGGAIDPRNWGPPTIAFPDVVELSDGRYQRGTRQSHTIGGQAQWRHGSHNISFGGDARLNTIDSFAQPDPRGTLNFTGAATGDAFADFLLGLPATSSIGFLSTSTRIRGNVIDAFVDDDIRVLPELTIDLGVRWEYEAPYSERDAHLANLDVAPGFTAASIITGEHPVGDVTGTTHPASLVHPDPLGIEPRVSLAWRPVLTSSLVIKAGYGQYRNLGVYQSIGSLLAQQPPYLRSFSVQTTADAPLTLANPFPPSIPNTTTFAVDPNFRAAMLHSWQVTAQRDFPGSMTVVAAYLGDHGTRLPQAFLPNTYAPGGTNACVTCPSGFTYLMSGGSSNRQALQLIVRRRLYGGFTATATYTLAKATDNAATFSNTNVGLGSLSVAQNWLDLESERGPSSFDQRHLLVAEVQYTTGVGILGGTLVDGFWGSLYKDWTVTAQLNTGSGLPVTPLVFAVVPGTGVVGIRPALTGEPTSPQTPGSYANPAAYTMPAPGTWGNAGRNSIRGPATFSFDMSITRTIRFNRRFNLDWRLTATNVLNRVTFTAIDRIITSPQFGHPTNANQMRHIVTSVTFRF